MPAQSQTERAEFKVQPKSGEDLFANRRTSVAAPANLQLSSKQLNNLIKFKVPKFDGPITKWLEYCMSVKTLIQENPEFHLSENFQYLKQSRKAGKAETILQNLESVINCFFRKKWFLFKLYGIQGNIDQLHQMVDKGSAYMTTMKSIVKPKCLQWSCPSSKYCLKHHLSTIHIFPSTPKRFTIARSSRKCCIKITHHTYVHNSLRLRRRSSIVDGCCPSVLL